MPPQLIESSSREIEHSADAFANLGQLVRHQADLWGAKTAFRFVDGEGRVRRELSYVALKNRAQVIAEHLRQRYPAGSRIILLFLPGLEFVEAFFGCMMAGLTAVPVAPPSRRGRWKSASLIVADADPSCVLTCHQDHDSLQPLLERHRGLETLAVDQLPETPAHADWECNEIDPHSLALLQYTSGSTGNPRGVMVSHYNLLANSATISHAFQTSPESRGVFWLPLFHDMGLIGGVLQTAYCGGSSTLMAPAAFLQRPRLWLELITATKATVSGGPDFAYQQCVQRIAPADRVGLDLSSWKVAFSGAEPVRAETLDRFSDAFASCGFRRQAFLPCYGLAEATLLASAVSADDEPLVVRVDSEALSRHQIIAVHQEEGSTAPPHSRSLVGCGPPGMGHKLRIVDPQTRRLCDDGQVGEIWLSGPSVTSGYFQRTEESPAHFRAQLADSPQDNATYLRTGDLGFLYQGELFVTGRLKDVIIIRGRNYYPQDIERTVEQADPALRQGYGVAFALDGDREQLVVVQEIEPRKRLADYQPVLHAICRDVAAEHDVSVDRVVLTAAGSIPVTSSGKKRRGDCRTQYLAGELNVLAERQTPAGEKPPVEVAKATAHDVVKATGSRSANEIQDWLVQRLRGRLHVAQDAINVHTPFVEFAMSSMDAVEITAELEQWLGRRLSPTAIYNYPTISALATWLAQPALRECSYRVDSPQDAGLRSGVQALDEPKLDEIRELSDDQLASMIAAEMAKHRN